jgi:hypothetical protein
MMAAALGSSSTEYPTSGWVLIGRIELPIRKQPIPLAAQYFNDSSSASAFAKQS